MQNRALQVCSRIAGAVLATVVVLFCTNISSGQLWFQAGHAGRINAVSWSPDGRVLATASDDATVKLWSTNGMLVRTFSTHPYQATAAAFSPDGSRLAIGTYAGGYSGGNNGLGRVLLWRGTNGWTSTNVLLERTMTNRFGRITAIAFSPDGTNVVAANAAGSNIVRRVSDGAIVVSRAAYNTSVGPAPVSSIAFSVARLFASGCDDGTIRVWDSTWTQRWSTNSAHASNVTAVAFSADGSYLATASLDSVVRLWSTTNWACVRTLTGHTSGVTAIAFAPNARTIASGAEDGTVKLWDAASGTCVNTVQAHARAVTSLAFSPNGAQLVSGGEDNLLKIWSVGDGTLLAGSGPHTDCIRAVAISPDGRYIASGADDQTIQIRRLLDGQLVSVLAVQTCCVSAICFAPNANVLASGGGPLDPIVKLWAVDTGTPFQAIEATTNGVTALAFSPDGNALATGGDYNENVIRVWDVNTGGLLVTLDGHSNGVTALAFSPNGNLLVSGGRRFDNTVKVWAVTNGSLIRAFTGHVHNIESIAFSPDGDTVASGSSGLNALRLWRVSDGSSRTIGNETNPVYSIAFSPDGSTIAAASSDTIKLWDVTTGALIQAITQETVRVSCLGYSPNGNLLVFGRQDATLAALRNTVGARMQLPLVFTCIAAADPGRVRLHAAVQPRTRYVIQWSTNLCDWTYLTIVASDTNKVEFSDTCENTLNSRFYRGITPP